jgi:hypothetical protein
MSDITYFMLWTGKNIVNYIKKLVSCFDELPEEDHILVMNIQNHFLKNYNEFLCRRCKITTIYNFLLRNRINA